MLQPTVEGTEKWDRLKIILTMDSNKFENY